MTNFFIVQSFSWFIITSGWFGNNKFDELFGFDDLISSSGCEINLAILLQSNLLKITIFSFWWSFSGENGFNQAIELAAESLANVKFIQEKKLINSYFDQISQDTGKYCFGVEDTLRALEMGAVETLICWENLDIQRYSLKNHTSGIFLRQT